MTEVQTKNVRPTKKQRELLDFIDDFIKEHKYSPSYREVMNGLDYTSVATVALHINSLIKRGHLVKRSGKARSLEVVAQPTNDPDAEHKKWLEKKVQTYLKTIEESKLEESEAEIRSVLQKLGIDGSRPSPG